MADSHCESQTQKETCEQCQELKEAYKRIMDKYNEHLKLYWEQKDTLKKSETSVKLLNDMLQQDKLHRKFLEERLDTAEQALFVRNDVFGGTRSTGGTGGKEYEPTPSEQILDRKNHDRWPTEDVRNVGLEDPPGNILLKDTIVPPSQTTAFSGISAAFSDVLPEQRQIKVQIAENLFDHESRSRHDISADHPSPHVEKDGVQDMPGTCTAKPSPDADNTSNSKKVTKPAVTTAKSEFPLMRPGNLVSRPGLGLEKPKPVRNRNVARITTDYGMSTSDSDDTTTTSSTSESENELRKMDKKNAARRNHLGDSANAAGDRKNPNIHAQNRAATSKVAPVSIATTKAPPSIKKTASKASTKGSISGSKHTSTEKTKALRTAESSLFKEWKKQQSSLDLMHLDAEAHERMPFADTESEASLSHPGKAFPAFRPTKSMQLKDEYTKLKYEHPIPQWLPRAGAGRSVYY